MECEIYRFWEGERGGKLVVFVNFLGRFRRFLLFFIFLGEF